MCRLAFFLLFSTFSLQALALPSLSALTSEEKAMLRAYPGLVVVKSIYPDFQKPSERIVMSGYGIIVGHEGTQYVMTTSHLSQGPVDVMDRLRTKLDIGDHDPKYIQITRYNFDQKVFEAVDWKYSVADNFQDVEIFELTRVQTLEEYAYICRIDEDLKKSKGSLILCVSSYYQKRLIRAKELKANEFVPLGLNGFLPRPPHFDRDELKKDFPLIDRNPDIVAPFVKDERFVISPFRFQTGMDVIDEQLWAPVKIRPGMSGLPFMNTILSEQPVIFGLVQGKARHFDIGWITETTAGIRLIDVLQKMKAEKKNLPRRMIIGDQNGLIAEWQMIGGMLIRKGLLSPLNLVFYEAIPNRLDQTPQLREGTGNGTRADTGNGTRADTGNGTRADTGNGTRADTGNGTRADTGGSRVFQEVNKWGMLIYSDKLGISKLTDIIAVRVKGYGDDFVFPANAGGMRILSNLYMSAVQKDKEIAIDFITPRSPMVSIIREQVRQRTIQVSDSHFIGYYWGERYSYSPDIRRLKTNVHFYFEGDKLRVNLNFEGDLVEFSFHPNGALVGGSATFTPIVEVKGVSGAQYTVDLSNLFFFDVSRGSFKHDALFNRFMIRRNGIDYVFYNRTEKGGTEK